MRLLAAVVLGFIAGFLLWMATNAAWSRLPESIQTSTAITLLIALYGAVLSTYREVAARRDKRPRADVSLSMSTLLFGQGKQPRPMISIWVRNLGSRPITINGPTSIAFMIKGHAERWALLELPVQRVPFPLTVAPDTSEQFFADPAALRPKLGERGHRGTIVVRAVVTDAVGRDFWSDWVDWETGL